MHRSGGQHFPWLRVRVVRSLVFRIGHELEAERWKLRHFAELISRMEGANRNARAELAGRATANECLHDGKVFLVVRDHADEPQSISTDSDEFVGIAIEEVLKRSSDLKPEGRLPKIASLGATVDELTRELAPAWRPPS